MIDFAKGPYKLYIDASPLVENKITGIPHFLAELVRALDSHPEHGKIFQVVLVVTADKAHKITRWKYSKIRVTRIPLPMRLFNLLWKYNMIPYPDLLLGSGVYLFPNYRNLPLKRSLSLTYMHDMGYVRYPQFVQPKNLQFLQTHMDKWVARTDQLLAGSKHAKQEIVDLLKVDPDKVSVIYHGVEHKVYYPRSQEEIHRVTQKYGIDSNYILHIGSLEPRKNIKALIDAYRMLPKELRKKYGLCLVGGDGWLNDDICEAIEIARQEGFNIMRPNAYVEDADLPAIISGASVLVHPALYEGFGLPPLQAMACGTPVAVANNSSLPEVVGKAGVLFDAEKVKDISDKIEEVLANKKLAQSLSVTGKKQAQKFGWGLCANELLACIQNLRRTP